MSGAIQYGILGAGRQGVAAAYDLVVRGDGVRVVLADADPDAAGAAADRVNTLTGSACASGVGIDAADSTALLEFLAPLDAAISAVPWRLNLGVTRAAIAAGTHVCDLGGNAAVVRQQLALDAEAAARGVRIVPDCGQVPGTGANLMMYVAGMLDEPDEVLLYDGGLPAVPEPPWNYALTFHIDGLTNEYDGATTYLVDGVAVEVACFEPAEYELVEWGEPFGTLEAFVTAGGTTTIVETLGGRVRTLKNKTLRYPGHAARFAGFRDAGLFGEDAVTVDGVEVVPRAVFHALLEPRIRATPETRDVVLNRAVARGRHRGEPAEAVLEVVTYYAEDLGFTAMQQATGWHAAIVCQQLASGRVRPGVTPVELAVDPAVLVDALRARGFSVRESVRPLSS